MAQAERIPRTIHYCWFGKTPMSELGERCVATWRAELPDYLIEKWDETRLDRSIPYVDIAYRAGKFAFVADYVRLMALYEHGGLYFDTDIEVIRSFDGLLDHRLFMGLQAPRSIGVGVIGSVKGHPFLRQIFRRSTDLTSPPPLLHPAPHPLRDQRNVIARGARTGGVGGVLAERSLDVSGALVRVVAEGPLDVRTTRRRPHCTRERLLGRRAD